MSQEKIDACYDIKEDSAALECMKELVRAGEGKCKPKLVLFTQEDCEPCEEEEALHKEALKEGVIQKLSVNTEEGMDIAIKNKIEFYPALVLLDCNNNIIYPTILPD